MLQGNLNDPAGDRFEKETGRVYSFNFRKTFSMVLKIAHVLDRLHTSQVYKNMLAWDQKMTFGKFAFKPNVYFSQSNCVIHDNGGNGSREGQTSQDWCFGIGILGQFPNFFAKNETPKSEEIKTPAISPPKKSPQDSTDSHRKTRGVIEEDVDFGE